VDYVDYRARNGVFVIYADKQRDYEAVNNLIERLQTHEPPIKVNSERDMIPTAPWLAEFDRMVRQSTYTVMLLSRDFLEDQECITAFRMAYQQSINERRQSLVAVFLEPREELGEIQDTSLKLFLRFNTYLMYNEVWFWEKLVHILLRNPRDVAFVQEEIEHVNISDDSDTDSEEEENGRRENIGNENEIELRGI
jgi:hypothetical protein